MKPELTFQLFSASSRTCRSRSPSVPGAVKLFVLRGVAGFKFDDEDARAGGLQFGVKFRRQGAQTDADAERRFRRKVSMSGSTTSRTATGLRRSGCSRPSRWPADVQSAVRQLFVAVRGNGRGRDCRGACRSRRSFPAEI